MSDDIDVAVLMEALMEVEENHLNLDCMTDACDHPDDEHPDYAIGCSDAAEIAAEYGLAAARRQSDRQQQPLPAADPRTKQL